MVGQRYSNPALRVPLAPPAPGTGKLPPLPTTSFEARLVEMSQKLETLDQRLSALQEIERIGWARPEDIVVAEIDYPTIAVGDTFIDGYPVKDVWGQLAVFSHLTILEVDIAAPQLATSDTVTLSIFRRGRFTTPLDLVAEFTGASQITSAWFAGFSNRRIEYTDMDRLARIYVQLNNASGNTTGSTFRVTITARRFPIPPGILLGERVV